MMTTRLKGLVALFCMLTFVPNRAEAAWLQAKSEHFTIYGDTSEPKLRDFAQKLEKFDFLLRRVTGIDDPDAGSVVHVYLLNNNLQIMQLARNRNVRGYYDTSDRFAYAALPRGGKVDEFDLGAQEILFHEYAHHFMLYHFPTAYPAWYVEGFAEFFSTIKFPKDGSIVFGNIPMYRAPGLVYGSIYPLKQLLSRNTDGLGLMDGDRYYGTAWLLTHFFQYQRGRWQEISNYLNAVAKGAPDLKLDGYFAGGVDGLEKDLRAYMKTGLHSSSLDAKALKIGDIAVSPLEAPQAALIDEELLIDRGAKKEELPDIIRSVRQVAEAFPQSAYAIALLAEAERLGEQKDAALVDADRAIVLDPKLSRAYSTRAMILLDRAHEGGKEEDWLGARAAIINANRADTEDPVPLMLFYRYHNDRGGPMPQLAYDGLYKAYRLLPQNPNYRFAMAEALARQGDYVTASRVLNPLAYSPHSSELREAASKKKAEYDAAAKEQPASAKKNASAAP